MSIIKIYNIIIDTHRNDLERFVTELKLHGEDDLIKNIKQYTKNILKTFSIRNPLIMDLDDIPRTLKRVLDRIIE